MNSPLRYTDPTGKAIPLIYYGGAALITGAVALYAAYQLDILCTEAVQGAFGSGGISIPRSVTRDDEPDNNSNQCEKAKQDARRYYYDLVNKRLPQYLSGGTKGPDAKHYETVTQKQRALRKAINRVRIYCKILPPELAEWERVANMVVTPWH